MSKSLEQRIAAALTAADITSGEFGDLITEVEAAAQAADADATKAHEEALDPGVVVDMAKVAAAVAAATLTRDRLQAALPRLRERYKEARLQEDVRQWNAEAEKLKTRRDEMVMEFATMLPVELIKGIAAHLVAMQKFDNKIAAHNWRSRIIRTRVQSPVPCPRLHRNSRFPTWRSRLAISCGRRHTIRPQCST